MTQVWALIVDSFRESRDKKLFWILLIVSTLAAAALACVGFDEQGWSLFFGAIRKPDPLLTKGSPGATAVLGAMVSNFLVGTYIGWLGVVAALAATAGLFPAFMESGSIDVILSKPMSRPRIFTSKYIGGLVFVLVQSLYFVLLTFVILRWQLGRWLWGYLWSIPLLVLLFSYLYCVCVLVAVWSRSALTALICTLLFWVAIAGAAGLEAWQWHEADANTRADTKVRWVDRDMLGKAIYVLHMVLPKTQDIPEIVGRQIGAGGIKELMTGVGVGTVGAAQAGMREEDMRQLDREEHRLDSISTAASIGSSLAFEAVVLLLAGWIFARKDF